MLRTIPRANLWEIHTPQVSSKKLFLEGFEKVKKDGLEVTDDVSVIEVLGLPVKLTLGKNNILKTIFYHYHCYHLSSILLPLIINIKL